MWVSSAFWNPLLEAIMGLEGGIGGHAYLHHLHFVFLNEQKRSRKRSAKSDQRLDAKAKGGGGRWGGGRSEIVVIGR